jgi:Cytochrome c3
LFRIILILVCGTGIQPVVFAADFSHRAHLAMGMECTTCHVTAAASTRVEDNNLPPARVCAGCHDSVAVKEPRATAVAHFSHATHVKALACVKCHAGMETSEVTSKANFPPMATCVGCHRQVDMPDSCWTCHAKTMRLRPETHVVEWVDSHSRVRRTAVEKQACGVCHGTGFHCAGCH